MLTDEEVSILDDLGAIYNRLCALPHEHPNDKDDVALAIHMLQRSVLARSGRRALADYTRAGKAMEG